MPNFKHFSAMDKKRNCIGSDSLGSGSQHVKASIEKCFITLTEQPTFYFPAIELASSVH
jgi:hypothetical protein